MKKLTNKNEVNKLVFLFMFTYMISYITRINYGAIISEMVNATGISKSLLSLSLTGSFVTYGAVQVISAILGARMSPKKLVTIGLVTTVVMNIFIPFCISPYLMLVVWCVNGFAQSFMWPPIVKLMTSFLSDDDYKKASVKVSWGSSFGTIAVYLCAPIIISLLGWKGVFFASAACGIVMIAVWVKCANDITPSHKNLTTNKVSSAHLFTPFMLLIMLVIVLQGMLRDGVTTWMPSYISETYNLSSIISILTGVVLPIFSIVCFQVAARLYRTKFTNPLTCAGVIFGLGSVSALGLIIVTGGSAALSVFFSAVLTGAMHGVNLILICMIPPFFKKYGNVSTVSGVLNSCTYIGSAISTYGIALLSERFNWDVTLSVWLLIAVLGTAICFICSKPWQIKMKG